MRAADPVPPRAGARRRRWSTRLLADAREHARRVAPQLVVEAAMEGDGFPSERSGDARRASVGRHVLARPGASRAAAGAGRPGRRSPCCRSRTADPTARTRRTSRRSKSALPADPGRRRSPRTRVRAWWTAARVREAMRSPAARRDPPHRRGLGRPRWPRRRARATPSPGSFADFYGKFRINARVVDAESGEILKVVSNDDPKLQDRAQLAAIVQLVSEPRRRGGRPAAVPRGRRGAAARACRPRRSPSSAAACCTRAGATRPRRRRRTSGRSAPYPDYPEARDGSAARAAAR